MVSSPPGRRVARGAIKGTNTERSGNEASQSEDRGGHRERTHQGNEGLDLADGVGSTFGRHLERPHPEAEGGRHHEVEPVPAQDRHQPQRP